MSSSSRFFCCYSQCHKVKIFLLTFQILSSTFTVFYLSQWGQVSPGTWQELFHNFTQGGSIWHGLNEHCSSNIQCGAEACCLKPNMNGRRAITDGNIVHFGRYFSYGRIFILIYLLYCIHKCDFLFSYCSKLRTLGETCSIHDNNKPYYSKHINKYFNLVISILFLLSILRLSLPMRKHLEMCTRIYHKSASTDCDPNKCLMQIKYSDFVSIFLYFQYLKK